MTAITLKQFRMSRHVPLDALLAELQRRYDRTADLDSLSKYEERTDGNSRKHWAGGQVGPGEFKSACVRLHNIYKAAGTLPDVRGNGHAGAEQPGLVFPTQGPAVVSREDFEPFWMDRSVSTLEMAALLELSPDELEAMARGFDLPLPKPYYPDALRDDSRPDPRHDGLTPAQVHNAMYVASSDYQRIEAARFLEDRGVDRAKLLRLYDTHPTRECAEWIGSTHRFYVALGVMDIPLRMGSHYAQVDHPEDFPTGIRRRDLEVAAVATPAPEPEPEPAPEPAPARVVPARLPTVAPAPAGYSIEGLVAEGEALMAERQALAGSRDAIAAEVERLQAQSAALTQRMADIVLRQEKIDVALKALRALA